MLEWEVCSYACVFVCDNEREREREKERKKERDGFAFFRHSACDAFINMCVCVLGGGEGGVIVGRQCSLGKRL